MASAAFDLGILANLATALAVLVALAIGLVQIRQFNTKRREQAAIELVHTIQTEDFHQALEVVMHLPEDITPQQIEAREDLKRAVNTVGYAVETFGVLVYQRILPLEVLDHLLGAYLRSTWRKMRPYAEYRRARFGFPNAYEWNQWLAEQLEAHPAPGKGEGAHVAFRDWLP